MSDVFISYSRADKEFVRNLHDALARLKRDAWVDWEDIPLTAEWLKEIYAGIEAADNFIFVISPESVGSATCLKEVAHASENNKRLIPIVHRPVSDTAIPESLAKINFIFLRDSDDFESTFASLVNALDTDLEWTRMHTRLLVRAKEWEREGRDASFLLRGRDLREAEEWQSRGPGKEPRPTLVHSDYILKSRRAAIKRQRLTLGAALAALLVTIGLALAALIQRNTAKREAMIALARQLAAQAESLRVQGPTFAYPAINLAIESARREPSPDAGTVLRRSMAAWRLLSDVKVGERVDVVALSPDARLLASGSAKEGIILVSDVATGREVARLQQIPFSTLPLMDLGFSPDGRWLAICGSQDGKVSVWDSTTGKQSASLEHGLPVVSLAFSPDSQWLATGGVDGSARVWRVGSWNEFTKLRHDLSASEPVTLEAINEAYASWLSAQLRAVNSYPSGFKPPPKSAEDQLHQTTARVISVVAFSRDGRRLATSSEDGKVALWEVGTWKSLARSRRDIASGVSVFSPDLKSLAFVRAAASENVLVLESGTGKFVQSLLSDTRVTKVAFSADGSRLVTAGQDGSAQVWDVLSGRKQSKASLSYRTALSSELLSIAFSPDGGQIVGGGEDDTARVWDSGTGRDLGVLPHQGFVHSVAFSADGRKLATGSWDGSARVWEPPQAAARLSGGGTAATFTEDGQRLAGGEGKRIQVWETATGKEIAQFQHESRMGLHFSPNGRFLGSGNLSGSVRVWDLNTGTMVSEKQLGGFGVYTPVVFSPDSARVAGGGWDGTARVWEAATGKEVARMKHKDQIGGLDFSPDGRWLATTSYDGTAGVWEASTGRLAAALPHGEKLAGVKFSPDSRWLATSPYLPEAYSWLWEAVTGRLVIRLQHPGAGNPGKFSSFPVFSPDSRWVATTGEDTLAVVWETSTGRPIAQLRHKGPVSSLAFSPNSRRLATGGDDGTVTVWQVEGAKRIAEFHLAGFIDSVLFSPNGRWVATASKDGTARLWDPETGREIMRAEQGEEVALMAFTQDGRFLAAAGGSVVGLHPLRLEELIEQACSHLSRNLLPDEWKQYLNDIPYRKDCSNLP